jgi:hypothetical protein
VAARLGTQAAEESAMIRSARARAFSLLENDGIPSRLRRSCDALTLDTASDVPSCKSDRDGQHTSVLRMYHRIVQYRRAGARWGFAWFITMRKKP